MNKLSRGQRTLKPLLEIGAAVYSAYWPPSSANRDSPPEWYPGVVSSYRTSARPDDERYGHVRYYNVHFDDGDEIRDVADHFVMGAEEYLLHLRQEGSSDEEDDEDGDNDNGDSDVNDDDASTVGRRGRMLHTTRLGPTKLARKDGSAKSASSSRRRRRRRAWRGVRNVTDRTSPDMWARHVGWHVASLGDGVERAFPLLSDALRAYDAHVVRTRCADLGSAGEAGLAGLAEELNLPEDWEPAFRAQRRGARAAAAAELREARMEGVREGMAEGTRRHRAELDRVRRDAEGERDAAVRDAVGEERRRMREMQSNLSRELKASHQKEMDALRRDFEKERQKSDGRIRELEREGDLSEKARREEVEMARVAERGLKPDLEVGDEVYAAWWPDSNRKEPSSWYPGRVKGYRELRGSGNGDTDNDDDDDSDDDEKSSNRKGGNKVGEYGPVRLYHIKYEDDGTETDGIPEHFVFPRADYLLATSRGDDPGHKWKGVQNIVDSGSSDEYARLVGWYSAQVDGREVLFASLAEAIRAHDAGVVRRRGDRTKSAELNLPEDWEWLFRVDGSPKGETDRGEELFDEEVLRKRVEKEKDRLRRDLERRHGEEMGIAIKDAVQKAVRRERHEKAEVEAKYRRDLMHDVEKRKARAVKEAMEEAQLVIDAAEKKSKLREQEAQHEIDLPTKKVRMELQQQFVKDRDKTNYWLRLEMQQWQQEELKNMRKELERSLSVKTLLKAQERLRSELNQWKATMLYSTEERYEMQQRQEAELERLETVLVESVEELLGQEKSRPRKDSFDEALSPSSPPVKRAKVSHGQDGEEMSMVCNITRPTDHREHVVKENLLRPTIAASCGEQRHHHYTRSKGKTAVARNKAQSPDNHAAEENGAHQKAAAAPLGSATESLTESDATGNNSAAHGHNSNAYQWAIEALLVAAGMTNPETEGKRKKSAVSTVDVDGDGKRIKDRDAAAPAEVAPREQIALLNKGVNSVSRKRTLLSL